MKIKDADGSPIWRIELDMTNDQARDFARVLLIAVEDPTPNVVMIIDHEIEDAAG